LEKEKMAGLVKALETCEKQGLKNSGDGVDFEESSNVDDNSFHSSIEGQKDIPSVE